VANVRQAAQLRIRSAANRAAIGARFVCPRDEIRKIASAKRNQTSQARDHGVTHATAFDETAPYGCQRGWIAEDGAKLCEGNLKLRMWYMKMTRTLLSGLSALAGLAAQGRTVENRGARETRPLKSFERALIDMLRRDATNIEYMMRGLNMPVTRERRGEGAESEERV
jgi:hypothetical protein